LSFRRWRCWLGSLVPVHLFYVRPFVSSVVITILNNVIILHRGFLKTGNIFTGEDMLAVLCVAHKYCMESIETEILSHFENSRDKQGFMNLMIASQIVGSLPLRHRAIQGLTPYKLEITLEEAEQIGLEAVHSMMTSLPKCTCGRTPGLHCICGKWLSQSSA
jgi:hypothetical protein